MAFSYTSGGTTSRGIAAYIRILFSPVGLIFVIYFLIGVFHNTAPPHIPSTTGSSASLHSWVRVHLSERFLISGYFGHAARLRRSMVSSS